MSLLHRDTMERLFLRARVAGARVLSVNSLEWDVAGRCERPQALDFQSRPFHVHFKHVVVKPGDPPPLFLRLHVPCRKCPVCLRRRARLWQARICSEIRLSPRTWFGTLTFAPEVHHRTYVAEWVRRNNRASDVGDELDYQIRVAGLSQEVTKWLKRLRKNTGLQIRYCLVAEAHKSGLPHYHCVMHGSDYLRPLKERDLRESFGLGHSKFNLVPEDGISRTAWYVAKYLTKDARTRVRASVHYGDGFSRRLPGSRNSSCDSDNARTNFIGLQNRDDFVTLPPSLDNADVAAEIRTLIRGPLDRLDLGKA